MIYRNRVKLEISQTNLFVLRVLELKRFQRCPNIADFDQSMLVRVILGAQAALACAFYLM